MKYQSSKSPFAMWDNCIVNIKTKHEFGIGTSGTGFLEQVERDLCCVVVIIIIIIIKSNKNLLFMICFCCFHFRLVSLARVRTTFCD